MPYSSLWGNELPIMTNDYLDVKLNLEELFYMPFIMYNLKIIYTNKYFIHQNKNIKLYQV